MIIHRETVLPGPTASGKFCSRFSGNIVSDRIVNSPHDDGFAMVYLPAEKILVEPDAYTPAAAEVAPAPPQAPVVSPSTLNLYLNIRRLKLDVARIVPLHGSRVVTMRELAKAAGREEAN
jgi:hypothetical protein